MKRPIIFLVADKNMNEVFKTFLQRDQFHRSLGCGGFEFDEKRDLVRHPRKDPGVYNEAHVFLRPYLATHERAVVVLDAEWDGSPGSQTIHDDISGRLAAERWEEFAVIVIDPELENWIWVTQTQPDSSIGVHDLVVSSFNYRSDQPLKEFLQERDNWREDIEKPKQPKEAVEKVLRLTNTPRSSALYRKIVCRASVTGCVDPAFQELVAVLRQWFPLEVAQ